VEFALGVLVSSILVAMWLVGSRRQRKADGERHDFGVVQHPRRDENGSSR
jgi:hypothetical protein